MNWRDQCVEWKNKWEDEGYNTATPSQGMSIYTVMDFINNNISGNHIIMTDAGSPSYVCPVTIKNNDGQRFIFNPSQADMGWAIPASVGVSLATNRDRIIVVIVGDGSFMSNIQELAVIAMHRLPIKIVVLNNNGYMSIRNTQSKFYNNRVYGVGSESGVNIPNIESLANAFELPYEKHGQYLSSFIDWNSFYPEIIEFECMEQEDIIPFQNFKILPSGERIQAGLEDMYPFMSDEELQEELKNVKG